ncbi:MAG: carboxylesterase/lipase family protein [Pseudomonadales bacterium]|jgi:para-nitrobenzyl esterase
MSIVDTRYGKIQGETIDGLTAFLGIPFAAPPTGKLRWAAPVAPEPWTGVRAADSWPGQAWQPQMDDMGPLGFAFNARAAANRNEDCLYLNVWTPGLDDRKRPVLVWIHGGGFSGGTGATPMYEGTALARRGDAVVVTINYRLGALGFLNLAEVTGGRVDATGNEGLLDQVMALEWVRDNIAAFGGDPRRVTIFGESAGGMSVGALMAFGPARGLFHRAIPQSGACSTAQTRERAAEVAQAVLDQVGISTNAGVEQFLALDPEKLVNAGTAASQQLGGAMVFQPCIDGTLLADLPIDAIAGGAADGVPVMVGATRDEWKLFTAMPGFAGELDDAALESVLSTRTSAPARVIDAYRQARLSRGEPDDANALYAAIETDRIFRLPAIRLAETLAARDQNAFQYLFTWESPWGDGALGSPHAIDIGFVFATHEFSPDSGDFFGRGTAADALAGHVQDAWLAFAADGDPRGGGLEDWAPYDTERRATALFGNPVNVAEDPFGEERAVWDEVDATLGSL